MSKKYNCEYCNNEVELEAIENDEHRVMADEHLCEDCFYDIYSYCDYCGSIEMKDDLMWLENNETLACEHCIDHNDNIIWCEDHDCYEYQDDDDIITLTNGNTICRDAYEYNYFTCEDCGEVYHTDDAYWSDYEECYYCEDCIGNHESEYISEYHDHDYEDEFRMTSEDEENDNKLFFGIEIEIEAKYRSSNHDNLASEILNLTDDFVFEQDGSLNNGFEIISMPFSKNYMKETLEDDLYAMLQTINEHNYEGKNTCGLHFHVSYEAIRSIPNLLKIVEYYKEELTILSRREESSLNRWSPFYTKNFDKEEITNEMIEEIVDDYQSRYHAINLDNNYTVEFRIFKSTTDHKTLMATWELVNNIVAFANDHEIKLNSMPSFYEIATYQENNYISEYMETMGLLATC